MVFSYIVLCSYGHRQDDTSEAHGRLCLRLERETATNFFEHVCCIERTQAFCWTWKWNMKKLFGEATLREGKLDPLRRYERLLWRRTCRVLEIGGGWKKQVLLKRAQGPCCSCMLAGQDDCAASFVNVPRRRELKGYHDDFGILCSKAFSYVKKIGITTSIDRRRVRGLSSLCNLTMAKTRWRLGVETFL